MDQKQFQQLQSLMRGQKGMTLIELIIVIGIGGLILLGVLAYYTTATARAENDREVRNVQSMLSEVRNLYIGRGTYGTNDMTPALITSRAIPESMLQTVDVGGTPTVQVRNSWNGQVTVRGAGSEFRVLYAGVPSAACARLVPAVLAAFQGVRIGGAVADGDVTAGAGGTITQNTADSVGAIATDCGAGATRAIAFVAR